MTRMPDSNTAELIRFEHFQAKRSETYEQAKAEWCDSFAKAPEELIEQINPVEERELLTNILAAYVPGDLLEFGANASQEIDELIERVAQRLATKETEDEATTRRR